ncbi:DUF506 family protein [Senna tora]|uniref:DUF506 family protein n=1 Tax=Senna tora TaxID=362788 RepID=A0A834X8Z9_9FABA|nr:DUF506 family protein [Senna tora]
MAMGSFEEDELIRMVQDFMESESPSFTNSSPPNCHTLSHKTQYFTLQDVLRSESSTWEEAKVVRCVMKHMKSLRDAQNQKSISVMSNWLVKNLKRDGLHASLYQTSWATSLGCPAGEYEYIQVFINEDENNGKRVRLIVDIDFRSQFELARPTQYYREMTESLPLIFIGSDTKLCKIISILCSAAKQSLRQRGLHVPPWRTTSYMQSKWLSGCHHQHQEELDQNNGRKENHRVVVAPKDGAPGGGISKWIPPMVKPKRMDMAFAGSALTCQFSNEHKMFLKSSFGISQFWPN